MSATASVAAWAAVQHVKTPAARLVLLRLAFRADENGKCWPGHASLARDCGLSDRSVRSAIAELETDGKIRVERRQDASGRDISSVYYLPVVPIQTGEFHAPEGEGENFSPRGESASGAPERIAPEKYTRKNTTNTTTTPPPCGGERKQTPTSKSPALPADSAGGDAGKAREIAGQEGRPNALREISVADSCGQYQAVLASAAIAAALDRAGTQRLADALAGALAAPVGDRARLKNRENPASWLAATAKAISAGEFVESVAYLSAVASRQAAQAARRAASGEEDDEHRQRLEAAAAAISIDPAALAAGRNLLARRAERRA